jgi:hypothetical protein
LGSLLKKTAPYRDVLIVMSYFLLRDKLGADYHQASPTFDKAMGSPEITPQPWHGNTKHRRQFQEVMRLFLFL